MKNIALLLPVIAGAMFGGGGVFVRTLADYGMDNATILFSRVFFGTILMGLFLLFYNKELLKIKLRDLPVFFGTGVLGMMALNLCYNKSIEDLTLSLASVLLCTAPVFVVIFAAILFKEKITKKKIFCIGLAIVGCIFASGLLESQAGPVSTIGVIFGILTAVFYSFYTIFSRMATDRSYNTYTVIFYSVLLNTIFVLPLSDLNIWAQFITDAPLFNIGYSCIYAMCTSILPYIFITLALLYAEAGMVSILASGAEPVAAVIFGLLFYAEIPTLLMLIGIAVTVFALTILCKQD